MYIKIYQIDPDRDNPVEKYRTVYDNPIHSENYNRVFMGEVDCKNLEDVYLKFNTDKHNLFAGHSLSTSDVVVTEEGAFRCQDVGFTKVEFDEIKVPLPDNLMRVVYVEPNRRPFITEIEHTLEAEQQAVGGLIEPIYANDDDTCLIGNEEAKLSGMRGNRRTECGIVAGPFFVCGLTEDDFRGLTDEEIEKYMQVFKEPENITSKEIEQEMFGGMTMFY